MPHSPIDPAVLPQEPPETRLFFAKDNRSSEEILRTLSEDSFWYVRFFVAANPKTPQDCLRSLKSDPDFRVRIQAENNLSSQIQEAEREGKWSRRSLDDLIILASHSANTQSKSNTEPER